MKSPDRREPSLGGLPLPNEGFRRGPRKICDFWGASEPELRGGMAANLNRKAISYSRANSDDMAKVEYSFPVDKVHGKVSKSHKIGFAHRKASKLNYTTSYGTRITPYSQDEMAHQEKFRAVAASTRARMKDPGKVMQDQAAFKEQSKYKTFYRYVFNQEWESYEG